MADSHSTFQDEIWASVPENRAPDDVLVSWVCETLLPCDGPLLDLGCGDGKLAAALSEDGVEVTGVDPSTVALERARSNAPRAQFAQPSRSGRLPLEDSSFAAAAVVNVLEHVADTQTAVSELRRVLAPGATVAIAVPANGWLRSVLSGPGSFNRRHDPLEPVLRFYTKRTLRELLEQFGFEDVRLRRSHGRLLAAATRA